MIWRALLTNFMIAGALLLFLPLPADAQRANMESGATNTSTDDKELLEWRVMMAENKFSVHKTRLNKYALIGAYEELLNVVCMSNMPKTFVYEGPGNNKKCLDLIEKVMQLDDGSPAATCARDGINSASCKTAYMRQIITSDFSNASTTTTMKIGRAHGGSSSKSDFVSKYARDEELDALETEYKKLKGDKVVLRKIKRRYREILSEACSGTRYDVRSREAVLENRPEEDEELMKKLEEEKKKKKTTAFAPDDIEVVESSVVKKEQRSAELDDLIGRLNAVTDERIVMKKEVQVPEDAEVLRVRILKPRCNAFVTRLLRISPRSSLGICFRDGLYSPSCIQSLRDERESAIHFGTTNKSKTRKTEGPGFATF